MKSAGINPLVHYLQSGREEKRDCSPLYVDGQRLSFDPRIESCKLTLPVKGSPASENIDTIAIHVHCHYIDVFETILSCLSKIPKDPDFYISCTSEKIKNEVNKLLENVNINVKRIFVSENRGRDIAPMLVELSDTLLDYELVLHFHTKKVYRKRRCW